MIKYIRPKTKRKLLLIKMFILYQVKRLFHKNHSVRKYAWKSLFFQKCSHCGRHRILEFRHQNCSYVDKLQNYYYICSECQDEVHDMYQDWWDEYNSSRS